MRKTQWVSLCIALIVAALFSGLEQRRGHYFLSQAGEPDKAGKLAQLMQRAEWFAYDLRFKAERQRLPHPDIVVIKIDEESLQRYVI